MKKISQAEAQRLKKEIKALKTREESLRYRYAQPYPGGVLLGTLQRDKDWLTGRVEAARLLRHAVVVTEDGGLLSFYALPAAAL